MTIVGYYKVTSEQQLAVNNMFTHLQEESDFSVLPYDYLQPLPLSNHTSLTELNN